MQYFREQHPITENKDNVQTYLNSIKIPVGPKRNASISAKKHQHWEEQLADGTISRSNLYAFLRWIYWKGATMDSSNIINYYYGFTCKCNMIEILYNVCDGTITVYLDNNDITGAINNKIQHEKDFGFKLCAEIDSKIEKSNAKIVYYHYDSGI